MADTIDVLFKFDEAGLDDSNATLDSAAVKRLLEGEPIRWSEETGHPEDYWGLWAVDVASFNEDETVLTIWMTDL